MLHDKIDRKKGYAAAVLFSALVVALFLAVPYLKDRRAAKRRS